MMARRASSEDEEDDEKKRKREREREREIVDVELSTCERRTFSKFYRRMRSIRSRMRLDPTRRGIVTSADDALAFWSRKWSELVRADPASLGVIVRTSRSCKHYGTSSRKQSIMVMIVPGSTRPAQH